MDGKKLYKIQDPNTKLFISTVAGAYNNGPTWSKRGGRIWYQKAAALQAKARLPNNFLVIEYEMVNQGVVG